MLNKDNQILIRRWAVILGILLLAFGTVYQFIFYSYPQIKLDRQKKLSQTDVDKKAKDIEAYLDQISPSFIDEVQNLATQYNLPSWGCGPSSYALAQIIDKKFFNDTLPIDATYDADEFEIVERFAFANQGDPKTNGYNVVDHAWLEIYMKDKLLFIDPTIAQFGGERKIAYHEFGSADQKISQYLRDTYGIYDIRFTILMQKVLNRTPKDQPPYPGATIQNSALPYYIEILEERNQLAAAKEPSSWKGWVTTLIEQFQ